MTTAKVCPLCASHGRISEIRSYQINFEEVVLLCNYNSCPYPYGIENFTIINREKKTTIDDKFDIENNKISDKSSNSFTLDEEIKIVTVDNTDKCAVDPIKDFEQKQSNLYKEVQNTDSIIIKNSNKIIIDDPEDDEKTLQKAMHSINVADPKNSAEVFIIKDPKMVKNLKLLSTLSKFQDMKKKKVQSKPIEFLPENIPTSVGKNNKISRFPKFSFEDDKVDKSDSDKLKIGIIPQSDHLKNDESSYVDNKVLEDDKYNEDFCDINFNEDLLWSNGAEGNFDFNNDITDEFLESLLI